MKRLLTYFILMISLRVSSQVPGVCISPSSGNPFSTGMGSYARSVESADFNNDGKYDLAIAGQSGSVIVMPGTGNGNFGTPTGYTVNGNPYALTISDFNNDGKADIATANFGSSADVSILLGNGTGGFSAATNFTNGSSPQGITAADLNSDGNKDLIITSSNSVAVMLGTGTGNFGAPSYYSAGMTTQAVTVADFNSDGKPDVASANRMSNNISVLFGTGSGSLQTANNYPVGAMFPCAIVSADFNSDGKPDLATSNFDFNNTKNVTVLLNTAGTFTAATIYSVSVNGSEISIASGDINGDGKTDIAAVNQSELGLLLGDGSGSFPSVETFTISTNITGVTLKDFNNDSRIDVAMAGGNNDNVEVYLNRSAIITTSGPVTFCSGGNVVLRATKGGSSYIWNPGGSTADSLIVNSSGTYSVTIMNGLCVSTSNTVNVTANPLPTVTITPANNVLCAGQNTTLTASGASTYTWNTGSTNISIVISPSVTANYTITGKDVNGCINTSAKTITVNPNPSLGLTSNSVTCNGSCNGSIIANGSGGSAPYTYSPSLTNLCAGNYTVTVMDSKGCTTLQSTTVTQPAPLVITTAANPTVICAGSASSIIATATGGTGILTYSWNTGSTNSMITVTPTLTTTYTASVKDANNCVTMSMKTVSVNPLPSVSVISSGTIICTGQSATLTANGAVTYTWVPSGSGNNIIVNPAVTSNYSVTGTDVNGCKNSAMITQSVSTCAGIEEKGNGNSVLLIYPNPNNGAFTVKGLEEDTLIIVNDLGQTVRNIVVTSTDLIEVSGLQPGIYFVYDTHSGFKHKIVVTE